MADTFETQGTSSRDTRVTLEDLMAFTDDDYYEEPFRKLHEGRVKLSGFNGYAALFGLTWCFWRKLYFAGFVVGLLDLVMSALAAILYLMSVGAASAQDVREIDLIGLVGSALLVRVPFGFLANRAYYREALFNAKKATVCGTSIDDVRKRIVDAGGTSWLGLLLAIAIAGVIQYMAR